MTDKKAMDEKVTGGKVNPKLAIIISLLKSKKTKGKKIEDEKKEIEKK